MAVGGMDALTQSWTKDWIGLGQVLRKLYGLDWVR